MNENNDIEKCYTIDPSLFAPWNWTGSITTTLANWMVNSFTVASILPIFDQLIHKKIPKDMLWPRELFVIIIIIFPTMVLFFFDPLCWIYPWAGGICLLNVFSAILRDVIVAPQKYRDSDGGFILVRSRLRWLLITPLQAYAIIICFALLLLHYGDQFVPPISDHVTALYQSALTFTTLGYGDIKPTDTVGRILVISELTLFLLFIGIKLPIAASVVRVKRQRDSKERNNSQQTS